MIQTYFRKLGVMAVVVFSMLATSESFGQAPIAQYNFNGSTGSEDSLAVDAQPANAFFYHARRGSAIAGSSGSGYITANNWPATFNANAFFAFGGRPNAGYSLTLNSVALSFRHSGTGPATFEIRSSLDNYTAVLKTVTIPSTTTSDVRDSLVLGSAFTGLLSKVEFRVFGYGSTATGGSGRLDKIKFYGSIQPTGAQINPSVGFKTSAATVAENVTGGTKSVMVRIANPSTTTASSVDVALGTTGTATAGTDFTFTGSTLTWAANDTVSKTVTVTIMDDAILDPNETVVLTLTNPSTGVTLGASTYTLTIQDNEIAPIPTYTVTQIDNNDPVNFLPDSAGVKVRVYGTLYGVNQRTTGLQLTLIDNTGGIGIFTSSAAAVPATAPVEGDSVYVVGTVGHFNGLTQINLDSIVVLANNRTLIQPAMVTVLNEATESELITIANPVSLVDPNQWSNSGSGFNVDVTDGTNTYQMRIVATSDIFGTQAPTGIFMLTGIGGQFDSSDPRDSGYQIIPRRLTDIHNVTGVSEDLANAINIYPNPVASVLKLNLSALNTKNATISVVNTLGQVVATVQANATELNVAKFPAGVYSLRIATQQGVAVKRFVKIN